MVKIEQLYLRMLHDDQLYSGFSELLKLLWPPILHSNWSRLQVLFNLYIHVIDTMRSTTVFLVQLLKCFPERHNIHPRWQMDMNKLYSGWHALNITADLMLHPPFFKKQGKLKLLNLTNKPLQYKKEKQIMLQGVQCVFCWKLKTESLSEKLQCLLCI